MNQSSTSYEEMMAVADSVREMQEDPSVTMIGESKDTILKEAFAASKAAGKPWQIWAAATALGRAVKGNYKDMTSIVDEAAKAEVGDFVDDLYSSEGGVFVRALAAHSFTDTPWYNDDFSGFAIEQREILSILKENSNNAIVLAGDLHDSYAWTLYEDGAVDGEPCAVNLVCPGVTSPGWGSSMYGIFNPLEDAVGGEDALYDTIEQHDEAANPGLKYFNIQFKGFYLVKATKETHVTEYFGIRPDIMKSNYATARTENNDGITAAHICDSHLTTTAGMPGSLDRDDSACGTIKFASTRPALWELPVPKNDDIEGVPTLSDCGMLECKSDALTAEALATEPPTKAPTAGAGSLLNIVALLVMSLGVYFVL
jgi:phosphodiesterase/alkaline phosphatase D-like protein